MNPITEYREKRNLTRSQLAELIGCNDSTIWNHETGNRNLSLTMLKKYRKLIPNFEKLYEKWSKNENHTTK